VYRKNSAISTRDAFLSCTATDLQIKK